VDRFRRLLGGRRAKTRRTVSQESFASRYGTLFLEILGFVLLFSGAGGSGSWATALSIEHMLLRSRASPSPGLVLRLRFRPVGIWANILDARVALKEDHKLIRTGPYAHFRHPVYSGIDLAAVAGALAIDQRQCVLGVSLIVLD
jgi:protein-S-isoprenylcysteine O-methyltransferase Ste14